VIIPVDHVSREAPCRRFCDGGLATPFFYSNEVGETAHVHRAGDNEAKFWLHDLSVVVNLGFPAHGLGDIVRRLRREREKLLGAWNEYFRN
jgi:Domain of unknown function (DUF4160)